ncbi:hypothetical protein LTR84_000124 [Exophiala bonariae]|uniref:GED domain-containing protein n=1 Tax=Exophiala bonariae TaxID=1690606 RepID=A0AAV9NQQ9_9EURO|nr:hypothetical protein LTR84_000124 [Exophiala bonariae]
MDISKSAIGSFQSPERLELLNDIDKFRQHGLHNLPQIVVCGDTSSGKSSVLGALSGINFPVSGTICTRFATEIALRYSAAEAVAGHAFITAAETASESHKSKVESFRREINSLDGIPALMDDARKQMGLPEVSGISRDVLHLRLEGRELPNLTLVDLPGLIHASRNTDDIVKVKGLVEDYFRQKESIILIVVSAENVIDNQGILTSSREFDPKGIRSIGVITKSDVLERPDKASLKPAIMELARNQNTSYQFTRGWHVVRCLNDKERTDGLDRDIVESQLFGQEQWKSVLQPKQLGMKSLRLSLSKYLHQHILQVLPELQKSLETEVKETKSSLELLGESRTTSDQRLVYLTRISRHYGKIIRDALEGNYSDAFFQDSDPVKRLRARTMALTEEYEEAMRSQGHSFYISQNQDLVGGRTSHAPEAITQSDALLKVEKLLNEHRGPELSFLFNPRLVGVLFKEQSKKWPVLTERYTSQIIHVVQDFLRKVLDFLCPSQGDTSYLIYHHILEDTIESKIDSLESKTRELFHPYEHTFLFSTKRRLQTSLKRIEDEASLRENGETSIQQRKAPGPEIMGSDHDTRVKLLQYSEAYYQVAIENFIDNVVVLGVESCLLSKLEAMFTLEIVLEMSEETRNLAGGESADTRSEREALNARLATLEKALKRCRTHTSRYNYHPFAQLPQPALKQSISKTGSETYQLKTGHVQRDILIPKSHAQVPFLSRTSQSSSSGPQPSSQSGFTLDYSKYLTTKPNSTSQRKLSAGDLGNSASTVSATTPTSKFTIPGSSIFADLKDMGSDQPHSIFTSTKNTATATPILPPKDLTSTSSLFWTAKSTASTASTATPILPSMDITSTLSPLTTTKITSSIATPTRAFGTSLTTDKAEIVGASSLSATNSFSSPAPAGVNTSPLFNFAKSPLPDQHRADGSLFGINRFDRGQVQGTKTT